jgi:hypothetical protein
MRTITDEVGSGPIQIITNEVDEIGSTHESSELPSRSEEREAVLREDIDRATGLDGKRESCELNLSGKTVQLGTLVHTVDNGPDAEAANDNDIFARQMNSADKRPYPVKELFERGDLGVGRFENLELWLAAQRFKEVHADAKGDAKNDTTKDDWRELLMPFLEGIGGDCMTSLDSDNGLGLSDDMEFEDSSTSDPGNAFSNGGWCVFRDMPPPALIVHAKQTVALAADVLGSDYPVLCAAVLRGYTIYRLGEKEGYKDRASASACGKGLLRSALRKLSAFFARLDHLEADVEPGKEERRPRQVWPLVGTTEWWPVEFPGDAWQRDGVVGYMAA